MHHIACIASEKKGHNAFALAACYPLVCDPMVEKFGATYDP